MKTINQIIIQPDMPNDNNVIWVCGNIAKYYNNGTWTTLGEYNEDIEKEIQNINSRYNTLNTKHESLSRTVQGIAVTGGASTANNVTYNNDSSGLNSENAQDAIDELQSSKFDKTSILQESGNAEDKVMSQKAVSDKFSDLLMSVKEESNPFDLSDEEGNVALRLNNGDLETANFSSKTVVVKDNLWSHDYDSSNWFDGNRVIHVVDDNITRSCVFPCKANKTYSFLRQNKDWYSEPKYSEIIFLDINKNVIGGTCNKQFPEYPTLNAQLYTNNIKIFNNLRYIVFTTPSNCAYFMANLYVDNQWDSRNYNVIVDKTQILNNVDVENSALYNKYPIRDVETRDLVLKALYPWSDKTWCALGDSLTEKNQWAKYQYWDYISAETGIKLYIRGISGSGFYWGKPVNGTDEQLHEYSFARRLKNTNLDGIDVLTVFGSFNDLLNPTDPMSILGTINDTTEDTIGGAINVGIQNFINRCSDTKIGIITPTPWQSSGNCTRENQDKYVELLISICRKYHIPYLDLYHFSGLQPDNADWRTKYYDSDNHEAVGSELLHNGIHPNSLGHKYFHGMIREFLKSLI